jgi:hypothetical protein
VVGRRLIDRYTQPAMADLVAKVSELDPHSPPASGSRDAALLPRGSKSMFETIARRRGTNAHDEKYVVFALTAPGFERDRSGTDCLIGHRRRDHRSGL